MDITFECNKCGQSLVVEEAGAGLTIDCPNCGKPAYVSSASRPRVPSAPVPHEPVKARIANLASPHADRVAQLTKEMDDKAELAKYMERPRRKFSDWTMGEYILAFAAAVAIVVVAVLFLRWDAQRRQNEAIKKLQEDTVRQMQDLQRAILPTR